MSVEDQLEFNLGDGETETDVAIEQSEDGSKTTAQVVKNEPEMDVEQEDAPSSHREELESVSEGVQKRISKLTARMREAERREQAAVDYAKGLQNQTNTLQQKLVNTDYSRLNETKSRLETQQQTLKEIIKRAREEGDIDTETEAHQRLTDMVMEQRQVAGYLQQQSAEIERYKQQPVQQQQVQQAPQKPAPSPRAEKWAGDNPWFMQRGEYTKH
jgi:chromosome segregation ATPase